MIRSVLLLRHAKSDRQGFSGDDFDRPLNQRGRIAAGQMGALLAAAGQVPELVLCSPAVRARTTLERSIAAGGWKTQVRHEKSLYLAEPEQILHLLKALPGSTVSVMLVGHEPGCSGLIHILAGGAHRMPTAAMARVDLNLSTWDRVERSRGELVWLLQPRFFSQGADRSEPQAGR